MRPRAAQVRTTTSPRSCVLAVCAVLAHTLPIPSLVADGSVDKIITASDKRRLATFAGTRGRAIVEARSGVAEFAYRVSRAAV